MAAFFRFWTRQAEARPFVTVAATEACLSACGDLLAQTIAMHIDFKGDSTDRPGDKERPPLKYDFARTARFVLFAASVSPIGVKWHRYLDRRFPIRTQTTWFRTRRKRASAAGSGGSGGSGGGGQGGLLGSAAKAARAKRKTERAQAARQVGKRLAFDVALYEPSMYFLFFGSMALLEGGGLEDAKYRISTLLLPTYLTGLTISPIIQSINFAFVPLIYRVPFGSCFDLFWDSYLSWVNNEKLAMINERGDADANTDA